MPSYKQFIARDINRIVNELETLDSTGRTLNDALMVLEAFRDKVKDGTTSTGIFKATESEYKYQFTIKDFKLEERV